MSKYCWETVVSSVIQDLCCAARQSLFCYGEQFYEIMQHGELDLSALECADWSKT